jgi:hypothetical protein
MSSLLSLKRLSCSVFYSRFYSPIAIFLHCCAAEKWLTQENTRIITIGWVLGHVRVKGNERADQLVKSGCTEVDSLKMETITHAQCKEKANTLLDWNDRWMDSVGCGCYTWANCFPPSWKLRSHFTDTRGN